MSKKPAFTLDKLLASAKKYSTKTSWRLNQPRHWRAAYHDPTLYARCCDHMDVPSNPYHKPYIVYAYEFADGYAYVGITFKPYDRMIGHLSGGSVFNHIKVCSTWSYRILKRNINDPRGIGDIEKVYIKRHKEAGWKMLNSSRGGSTGGVGGRFTDVQVLESARKYRYKWEWKKYDFKMYLAACRKYILKECMAHMPARSPNARPRKPITDKSRASFKIAALKRVNDPTWVAKNAAVRKRIADGRRGTHVSEETRQRMCVAAANRKKRLHPGSDNVQ